MFDHSCNIYHAPWPNIARDGQQKNINRGSVGRIDAGRTDLKPFVDGQRAFYMAVIIFSYFPPYDFGLYLIVKPTAFATFWSRVRPQSPLKTLRGEQ